ncbi:MAG: hypothetical protein PHF94_06885, partial [Methanothrix sp.]|nr:hypothetical protein [Methanothrix sp.]
ASWRGRAIGEDDVNCLTRFCSLEKGINYYYPPDSGFLAANGKKLLDEVTGRILKHAAPSEQRAGL